MEIPYCWVSRHDYDDFKFACVDGNEMPADYEAWMAGLEKFVEGLRARGMTPVQVNIKPQAFADWCDGQGIAIDADGRIKYAAHCRRKAVK
jgi:hypothetical protein